jgi:hypothetical protein
MMQKVFVDSFGGMASNLPPRKRNPDGVLEALRRDPRVSVWDMFDNPWLRNAITALAAEGRIVQVEPMPPFPWIGYAIVHADQPEVRHG